MRVKLRTSKWRLGGRFLGEGMWGGRLLLGGLGGTLLCRWDPRLQTPKERERRGYDRRWGVEGDVEGGVEEG